ncbi:MAG: prepilin-type N-terminal cleavage/methylation domain-containing protein [Phycisphaerales bacterium]|nr:prepilin-type N-terminal cleavage/methylation domain-containing protein [Phycisphaerales bacterium]
MVSRLGQSPTLKGGAPGFTLVELLVVVSIVALLLSILLPSLRGAREEAKATVCASNIRQLALANLGYTVEYNGRFCPGACDFLQNKNRWHGKRESTSEPFDGSGGPLVPYLGTGGAIRSCPSFREPLDQPAAFERASGGYGYNLAYLGRELRDIGYGFQVVESDKTGVQSERIKRPADTVMFADTAFAVSAQKPAEYSFAEPRYLPTNPTFRADPSIHFRHIKKKANAAWADGHVDRRKLTFTWSSGLYLGQPEAFDIGWFGDADDNSYFDLK